MKRAAIGAAMVYAGICVLLGFLNVRAAGAEEKCAPSTLGVMNVKDCGTVADGKNDDTGAIRSAIAAAEPTRAEIYFPPGRYLVTAPVRGFSGIVLAGEAGSYSYSTSGIAAPGMPSVLVASADFGNRALLDFTRLTNTAVLNLGFDLGATQSYAVELGSRQDGTEYPNHQIDRISVRGGQVGIRARNAGLLHIRNSNFSDAGYIAIWLDGYTGDSDLEGNYVNGTYLNAPAPFGTPESVGPAGTGIYVGTGSGNVNIHGGKIEWNAIGVLISNSQGITITGVNFDYNTWGHVVIHGYSSAPQIYPRGVIINGNRLLSGGTQGSQSAIYIDVDHAEAIVSITGNSFRMAAANANDFDGSPEDSRHVIPTTGPKAYGIRIDSTSGIAHVNITGNEMFHCAGINSIRASGPGIAVHDEGNLKNPGNNYTGGATRE